MEQIRREGAVEEAEDVCKAVVDCAVRVHQRLGPGLYESVYEQLLGEALVRRGFHVERQKRVAFEFEGARFAPGLSVDLLVNECVVVEVKAVEKFAPVHTRQTLTYLRLMNLRLGMLLNFGYGTMREGIRRVINTPLP